MNRLPTRDAGVEIERRLADLARLSAAGEGVTRLAYSEEDFAARRWFKRECGAIGLSFEMDEVGNCFGWTGGPGNTVLIGSHLDSVINGGRYDGALGVVTALTVARLLLREDPAINLGVVAFACEESTRLGIGCLGSRLYMGDLSLGALRDQRDIYGRTLGELIGSQPNDLLSHSEARRREIGCYCEVHVDQGTTLAAANVGLGIATFVAGMIRLELQWRGEAAHSGGRQREERRDALLAASEYIIRAHQAWERSDGGSFFAQTIGQLEVKPNSPNTVAGYVRMVVDIRAEENQLLHAAEYDLRALATEVASRSGVEVEIQRIDFDPPVRMAEDVREIFRHAAEDAGIQLLDMPSYSGHDAAVIARACPAGLLFVANPSGISHSPAEDLSAEPLSDLLRLLMAVVPRLATIRGEDV